MKRSDQIAMTQTRAARAASRLDDLEIAEPLAGQLRAHDARVRREALQESVDELVVELVPEQLEAGEVGHALEGAGPDLRVADHE